MMHMFMPKVDTTHRDRHYLARRGYKIGAHIDSGAFGRVHRATIDDLPCAVKVIPISNTVTCMRFLPREVYALKKFRHPHLLQVYDIFALSGGKELYIFMELAAGGSLFSYIAEQADEIKEYLREPVVASLYRQFGDALRYMHSLGYAHRDIKTENILLLDETHTKAKLTDFGLSRAFYDITSGTEILANTHCGTLYYLPPELCQRFAAGDSTSANEGGYESMKADIWSMGITLYMMLNNDFPFWDMLMNRYNIFRNKAGIDHSDYNFVLNAIHRRIFANDGLYYINRDLSKEAKELIEMHLRYAPEERPRMETILQHRWFRMQCDDSMQKQQQ